MFAFKNSRPVKDDAGADGSSIFSAALRQSPNCAACATRRHCPIGAHPLARERLAPSLQEHKFVAGQAVKRQGDLSRHLTVIKLGLVGLQHGEGGSARARPVALAGRGFALGMSSLFRQGNELSAIAVSAGRCCKVDVQRVAELARADLHFGDLLGELLSANLTLLARWTRTIGAPTVTARVAGALRILAQSQSTGLVALPAQGELARLLGTTRESVARSLALLETAGCVARPSRGRYSIDLARLEAWLMQR